MKYLPIFLIILASCQKETTIPVVQDQSEYLAKLYHGVTDRQARGTTTATEWDNSQIGRISFWAMFNKDSYASSRADYMEFLLSDNFTSALTADDQRKPVDANGNLIDNTDVFAIKNYQTPRLLWKEYRKYPVARDTVELRTFKYTCGDYWFRTVGNNFPSGMNALLYDRYLNTLTYIPVKWNTTKWYQIHVGEGDYTNGMFGDGKSRFAIILEYDKP